VVSLLYATPSEITFSCSSLTPLTPLVYLVQELLEYFLSQPMALIHLRNLLPDLAYNFLLILLIHLLQLQLKEKLLNFCFIYFSMYKIDVKILPYVTTPIFWGWVRSLGLGGNALEEGQGHCWVKGKGIHLIDE
jgi:hypothetical protein